MTITYRAANILEGLRTDTKPSNVPTGSRFFETDTFFHYYYNGTTWKPESQPNLHTTVLVTLNTDRINAIAYDGTLIDSDTASGSNHSRVIQSAMDYTARRNFANTPWSVGETPIPRTDLHPTNPTVLATDPDSKNLLGGSVYIRAPTAQVGSAFPLQYKLFSPLVINYAGLSIRGDGSQSTILYSRISGNNIDILSDGNFFSPPDYTAINFNTYLKDFQIDGHYQSAFSGVNGVHIHSTNQFIMESFQVGLVSGVPLVIASPVVGQGETQQVNAYFSSFTYSAFYSGATDLGNALTLTPSVKITSDAPDGQNAYTPQRIQFIDCVMDSSQVGVEIDVGTNYLFRGGRMNLAGTTAVAPYYGYMIGGFFSASSAGLTRGVGGQPVHYWPNQPSLGYINIKDVFISRGSGAHNAGDRTLDINAEADAVDYSVWGGDPINNRATRMNTSHSWLDYTYPSTIPRTFHAPQLDALNGVIQMGSVTKFTNTTQPNAVDTVMMTTSGLGIPKISADPTTTSWGVTQKGLLWFNTTTNVLKYWDGAAIKTVTGT